MFIIKEEKNRKGKGIKVNISECLVVTMVAMMIMKENKRKKQERKRKK